MMQWKWTQGEAYEKSRRRQPSKNNSNHHREKMSLENIHLYDNKVLDDQQIEQQANNAFTIALNHDEYTWDMLNPSSLDQGFRQVNKREDTDKKLAERQMFANVNMNPFLTGNDYANDISVQNHFLQPQTSICFEKKNL